MGCGSAAQAADILADVVEKIFSVLKSIGYPEYSSARSKRTFSDHVKIGLLVVRQLVRKSYEDFVMLLPSLKGVIEVTGIKHIPDPSTLWKFAGRLEHGLLEDILQTIAGTCCSSDLIVAVDSTGFSLTNIPRHMEKRVKEFGVRREEKTTLHGENAA